MNAGIISTRTVAKFTIKSTGSNPFSISLFNLLYKLISIDNNTIKMLYCIFFIYNLNLESIFRFLLAHFCKNLESIFHEV